MKKKMPMGDRVIYSLFVISVLIMLACIFRGAFVSRPTQSARIGTYSSTIPATAYVVRNEAVVSGTENGIVEADVDEGQRVAAYAPIGALITGDVDSQAAMELAELNAQIETLRAAMSEAGALTIDESKISAAIESTLKNLKYSAAKQNSESALAAVRDIEILAARKNGTMSADNSADTLDALISRRDGIAAMLGGVRNDLYAPKDGVYSSNVDGLESVLTPDMLDTITPDFINSLNVDDIEKKGGCKIIDNYKWYLIFNLPSEQAESLSVGKRYSVTFTDVGDAGIQGVLQSVSEPDSEGICAAVMRFNCYIEDFTSLREVEIRITTAKYSGIYLPVSALRVKDGETGVYVLDTNRYVFRTVTIVYRNDDFILAKRLSDDEQVELKAQGMTRGLALYDDVLVDADLAEDGK